MNPTEKYFFFHRKGSSWKYDPEAKEDFFFFSALEWENIYFGGAIEQKTYFNVLNLVIQIISISKQILWWDLKKGFSCAFLNCFARLYQIGMLILNLLSMGSTLLFGPISLDYLKSKLKFLQQTQLS